MLPKLSFLMFVIATISTSQAAIEVDFTLLEGATAQSYHPATLHCEGHSNLFPEVKWYYKGNKITDNSFNHRIRDHKSPAAGGWKFQSSLEINKVAPTLLWFGRYTCVVCDQHNERDYVKSHVQLTQSFSMETRSQSAHREKMLSASSTPSSSETTKKDALTKGTRNLKIEDSDSDSSKAGLDIAFTQTSGTITVGHGEDTQLVCRGNTGIHPISIAWYHKNREVHSGGRYHIESPVTHVGGRYEFGSALNIRVIQPYDYGDYLCVVINANNRRQRKFSPTMTIEASDIHGISQSKSASQSKMQGSLNTSPSAKLGNNAPLETASSHKNEKDQPSKVMRSTRSTVKGSAASKRKSEGTPEEQTSTQKAGSESTKEGQSSKKQLANVSPIHVQFTKEQGAIASPGDEVTLKCDGNSGQIKPKIKWIHRKKPVTNGPRHSINVEPYQNDGQWQFDASVTITDLREHDFGEYYCTVTNAENTKDRSHHVAEIKLGLRE